MEHFKYQNPDPNTLKVEEQPIAKFGHLNAIVDKINILQTNLGDYVPVRTDISATVYTEVLNSGNLVSATSVNTATNTSTIAVSPIRAFISTYDNTTNIGASVLTNVSVFNLTHWDGTDTAEILGNSGGLTSTYGDGNTYAACTLTPADARLRWTDSNGSATVLLDATKISLIHTDGSDTSFIQLDPQNVTIETLKLLIQGIGTFADNAAALAGGLVVNNVYKTATGELRIVV